MTKTSGITETIDQLRLIVDHLHKMPDIQKGALFHDLPGSMTDRLKPLNVKALPDTLLLMQELGLSRHSGSNRTTVWQVADLCFFDEFVSTKLVERAQQRLFKRTEMLNELRLHRQRTDQTPADEQAIDEVIASDSPRLVEQMAEMVAEVERLREADAANGERIAELEKQLAERPKEDPTSVAAALVERFKRGQA